MAMAVLMVVVVPGNIEGSRFGVPCFPCREIMGRLVWDFACLCAACVRACVDKQNGKSQSIITLNPARETLFLPPL